MIFLLQYLDIDWGGLLFVGCGQKSFKDLDDDDDDSENGGFKTSLSSRERRARRNADKQARK